MGFFEAIFLIIRPTRLATVSVRPFDLITVSVVDYGILAHRVEVEEGRLEIIVGSCKTKFMSVLCFFFNSGKYRQYRLQHKIHVCAVCLLCLFNSGKYRQNEPTSTL